MSDVVLLALGMIFTDARLPGVIIANMELKAAPAPPFLTHLPFRLAKQAILRCEKTHIAQRKGLFCNAKWHVSQCVVHQAVVQN